MNKIRTITGGIDTPDPNNWTEQLRVMLGMGAFPHDRCVIERTFLRCLFVPSFHAECWVEIEQTDNGANVLLQTHQTNLWNWSSYRLVKANSKLWPNEVAPDEPCPWTETAKATVQQFNDFARRIPLEVPKKLDLEWLTLDGMQVTCDYHRPSGQFDSFGGRGSDDPATFELVKATCWLADEVLTAPESKKALQSIRGYFS